MKQGVLSQYIGYWSKLDFVDIFGSGGIKFHKICLARMELFLNLA
jgi:hypothetical protein